MAFTALKPHHHQLTIAITGLKGAGKTVFITSLISQLVNALASPQRLARWSLLTQGRLLGVEVLAPERLDVMQFPYQQHVARLTGLPAQWPQSTEGLSQLTLAIWYQPRSKVARLINDRHCLQLTIIDYPGEWLLDLSMLGQDYQQWSAHVAAQIGADGQLQQLWSEWLSSWQAVVDKPCDHENLTRIARDYRRFAELLMQQIELPIGIAGRVLMPDGAQGTPMLDWFPWLWQQPIPADWLQALSARYVAYRNQLVKPFAQQHLARVERQVLLLDPLRGINRGIAALTRSQQALHDILSVFRYGSKDRWLRWFNQRVEQVLVLATKGDEVTPEQQPALESLLKQWLAPPLNQVRVKNAQIDYSWVAAIRATELVEHPQHGTLLQGMDVSGEKIRCYPGDMPSSLEQVAKWQHWQIPSFAPPELSPSVPFNHLNMDKVIERLLAQELR